MRRKAVLFLILACLLKPACGGNGSGGPPPPPGSPLNPVAVATDAQITLTWNPVAGAASYTVYRATVTGVTKANWNTLAGGAQFTNVTSPLVQTGLTNGTTYFYVVTATNAGGEGPESLEASATPVAPPTQPTGVTATPGNQQVTVSWNPVAGAASYTVYRATVTGVTKANWNSLAGGAQFTNVTSPLVQTGLTNGTTYFYVVTATNISGEGPESSQASAQPVPPPSAPSTLTLTPSPSQIVATWSPVVGASSYVLYRATVPGVTPLNYAGLPGGTRIAGVSSPHTDLGRVNGTAYYYAVTAVGPGGEGTASPEASAIPINLTWNTYPAGSSPLGMCTADFNRDGIPDLALSGGTGNFVRILTGVGDGTFVAGASLSVTIPRNATVEDFNQDGKTDLVVCSGTDILFFPGNGDGTFGASTIYTCSIVAWRATVLDANRDGFLDLVIAPSGTGNQISLLLGNGDGSFQAPQLLTVGTQANEIAVADLNGDGRQDLAVTNVTPGTVSILLGNALGGFDAPVAISVGTNPQRVLLEDFNGDGRPDLAVGDVAANRIIILLGNGSGGFGAPVDCPISTSPTYLLSADLNGDGRSDIAVSGVNTSLYVLPGRGDGTFFPPVAFNSISGNHQIVVADFNHDGKPDLANSGQSGTGYGVYLNLNTFAVSGQYPSSTTYDMSGSTMGPIVVRDLNRDGRLDLTVAGTFAIGHTYSVLRGGPGGVFGPNDIVDVVQNHRTLAIADFNRDGKPDLAMGRGTNPGAVSVFIGVGDGTFGSRVDYPTGAQATDVVAADFNRDGKTDLAVGNYLDNTVSILLGSGDGTFGAATTVAVGSGPQALAAGDLNRDGKPDLVVANDSSSTITVLLGNGDGTFSYGTPLTDSSGPSSVVLGDLNRDGKLDLISSGNMATVRLGNGDGSFGAPTLIATGTSGDLKLADLDRNGTLDLLLINTGGSATFSTLQGNGAGGFSAPVVRTLPQNPLGIAVGDFDGDGRPDLAVAHSINQLSIYFSR
jgi:fibronectin type 3 domain-containing protein